MRVNKQLMWVNVIWDEVGLDVKESCQKFMEIKKILPDQAIGDCVAEAQNRVAVGGVKFVKTKVFDWVSKGWGSLWGVVGWRIWFLSKDLNEFDFFC